MAKPVGVQEDKAPLIVNRMEDCGEGRHVGWWSENHIGYRYLLIEIESRTVIFSCCKGERAERRITFVVDREKGVEIAKALALALGIGAGQKGGIARREKLSPERRAEIARNAANTRWKRMRDGN